MSCPDLDAVLDAGFDASPHDRRHLAECSRCADELSAAAALAAGFAEMRAEAVPPDLLDSVLAAAPMADVEAPRLRVARAGDRAPRRADRRWGVLTGALLACAALVAVWLRPGVNADRTADLVADQVQVPADPPAPPPSVREPAAPTPPDLRPDPPTLSESAPLVAPAPDQLPPPSQPADPVPTAPALPEPTAPAPPPTVQAPEPAPLVAEAPALPDSVASAREGALLALGLVADAQRSARRSVAGELERLGSTLSDASSAYPLTP